MLENQERIESQMCEKYSVEKLFDNAHATVVSSVDDLDEEKEDFTKPRVVQRYSQYTQTNTDIQDYTDHVQEQTNVTENTNLPTTSEEAKGFFQKIKSKICSIFGKR